MSRFTSFALAIITGLSINSVHAQDAAAGRPAAQSRTTAAAGLSDVDRLMQEEKYDQALARLDELLRASPGDATLLALRQQVAAASPARAAAAPGAPIQQPPLTGRDRLELDSLRLAAKDFAESADARRQSELAEEVLRLSAPLVTRRPELVDAWAFRAAAALHLDRPREGWEAGRKLEALGALDRADELPRRVMAQLNRRGWLQDKYEDVERVQRERAAAVRRQAEADAAARQQQAQERQQAEARVRELERMQGVLGNYTLESHFDKIDLRRGSVRVFSENGQVFIEADAILMFNDGERPPTRASWQVKIPRQPIQFKAVENGFVDGVATGDFTLSYDYPRALEPDVNVRVQKATIHLVPQRDQPVVAMDLLLTDSKVITAFKPNR